MYPITYEADFNPEPNRWTTFFRLILAIPWLIVATFWGILFLFTHFFAWVSLVILGRYPQWLYEFNSGVVRFSIRAGAWLYLQTDQWPPFGLRDDPAYPVRVAFAPAAARQSRPKAFFRLLLAVPIWIVAYWGVASIYSGAAIVAWLSIVFRGYQADAINGALAYCNSLFARVFGYIALLTDEYPPIGLERIRPAAPTQQ